MERIRIPIFLATLILLAYTISTQLNVNYSFIFFLFVLMHVAFIWMVIKILKDGEASKKSFDEFFYEDREDLKRS